LKTLNIDPNCIKGLLTKLLLIICWYDMIW